MRILSLFGNILLYGLLFLLVFGIMLYSGESKGGEDCDCVQRKYSVSEIARLREVCEDIYLFGTAYPFCLSYGSSRSYKEVEKVKKRLRSRLRLSNRKLRTNFR